MHPYVCRKKLSGARQIMHVSPRTIPRGAQINVLFAERDTEAHSKFQWTRLGYRIQGRYLSALDFTGKRNTLCVAWRMVSVVRSASDRPRGLRLRTWLIPKSYAFTPVQPPSSIPSARTLRQALRIYSFADHFVVASPKSLDRSPTIPTSIL